ncbi:MAG: hypothetical protein LBL81_04410 [Tannerella sp.]|jgi:hypothetical protein|nr:hypothetical protein [Tannerella sp.]
MLLTILATVLILLGSVALLSIRILLKKGGTFPAIHIDSSPALQQRGIHCATAQDEEAQRHKDLKDRLNKK